MLFVLLLVNLLIVAVCSLVLALIEALLFTWIWPYAGITAYDPTYWQAFALCVLVNILVGFSGAVGTSTSSK